MVGDESRQQWAHGGPQRPSAVYDGRHGGLGIGAGLEGGMSALEHKEKTVSSL